MRLTSPTREQIASNVHLHLLSPPHSKTLSPRGVCSRIPHLPHFCRDSHGLFFAHVYAYITPFISFAHQHVSLSIDSSSSPFLHQRQDDARGKLHLHDREKYSPRVLKPRRVDAAAAVLVRLADDAETPGHFALNPRAISLVQSFDPSLTAMTSSRFSVSASRMRTPYWILSSAASMSWRVLESNASPMAMMGNPRARYGSA